MKSLICFAVVLITIACTETNNYYFVYSDGEWVKVDENPMADKDHQEVDISQDDSDNENVDVNDDGEVVNEEDIEPDEDSNFLDEENPEEILPDEGLEITDDVSSFSDDDIYIPPEPCKEMMFLEGVYWENIKNSADVKKTSPSQQSQELCCTDVSTQNGHYDSFCGNTFPQISPTSGKTLDYKPVEDQLLENNAGAIETYKRKSTK